VIASPARRSHSAARRRYSQGRPSEVPRSGGGPPSVLNVLLGPKLAFSISREFTPGFGDLRICSRCVSLDALRASASHSASFRWYSLTWRTVERLRTATRCRSRGLDLMIGANGVGRAVQVCDSHDRRVLWSYQAAGVACVADRGRAWLDMVREG